MPNGAERILAMAESQQQHRQGLEKVVVEGNVAAQKRGQVYAFTIALLAILAGCLLIWFGKDAQGLGTIISALVALVTVFIVGRRQHARERQQKREELKEAAEDRRLPFED